MADGDCVIGGEVTLIERRGDKWVLDGAVFVTDLSKCKILPSAKERRLVLSTIDESPKAPIKKKKNPEPQVILIPPKVKEQYISVPPPPPSPPPQIAEVLEVVEETLIEKISDKLGDNALGVVMLVGFALFKKLMEGQQGRAQEEMNQKCSGRHSESASQTKELETQIDALKKQLEEMSSNIEWSKSNYASRGDLKKLTERLSLLEDAKKENEG